MAAGEGSSREQTPLCAAHLSPSDSTGGRSRSRSRRWKQSLSAQHSRRSIVTRRIEKSLAALFQLRERIEGQGRSLLPETMVFVRCNSFLLRSNCCSAQRCSHEVEIDVMFDQFGRFRCSRSGEKRKHASESESSIMAAPLRGQQ